MFVLLQHLSLWSRPVRQKPVCFQTAVSILYMLEPSLCLTRDLKDRTAAIRRVTQKLFTVIPVHVRGLDAIHRRLQRRHALFVPLRQRTCGPSVPYQVSRRRECNVVHEKSLGEHVGTQKTTRMCVSRWHRVRLHTETSLAVKSCCGTKWRLVQTSSSLLEECFVRMPSSLSTSGVNKRVPKWSQKRAFLRSLRGLSVWIFALLFARRSDLRVGLEIGVNGDVKGTGLRAADGTWHHIAVTWNSADGTTIMYNDGVEVFRNTFSKQK